LRQPGSHPQLRDDFVEKLRKLRDVGRAISVVARRPVGEQPPGVIRDGQPPRGILRECDLIERAGDRLAQEPELRLSARRREVPGAGRLGICLRARPVDHSFRQTDEVQLGSVCLQSAQRRRKDDVPCNPGELAVTDGVRAVHQEDPKQHDAARVCR
jgi:hypothetical protein